MRYINYFYYQWKRSIVAFSHMIGGVLLLLLLTILAAWGISKWFSHAQIFQKVTVGVVIPEGAETTELVAKVISGMDSVKSICTFTYLEKEEATEKLYNNEIQAAIELSEDFYEDVDTGVNTPVTVFFSNANNMNIQVFQELLQEGVGYVQLTESAVYAATDHGKVYEMKLRRGKMQELISGLYVTNIAQRNRAFSNSILSETGEVNFEQYYLVIGIFIFILLIGIHFGFFYRRQEKDTEQKLKVMGIHPVYTSAVRVCIMMMYIFILLALTYLIGCKICEYMESSLLISDKWTMIGCLPLAFSVAAFFHMVFSFSKNEGFGMLLLLGLDAIMLICSGGIIPIVYFPAVIQKIGSYLPLTFWMDYLQRVFFGKDFGQQIIMELIIGTICFMIGTVRICKNT